MNVRGRTANPVSTPPRTVPCPPHVLGVRRLGLIGLAFALALATDNRGTSAEELTVAGLNEPVEILRDRWGIAHIYARNEHDLFFAQGFNVARDRLFQLELWRRQATGTLAEIQGPRALAATSAPGC